MRRRFSYLGDALSGVMFAACLVLAGCGAGDGGKTAQDEAPAQAGTPSSPAGSSRAPVEGSATPPGSASPPVEIAAAPQSPGSPATTGPAADGALYICVLGTSAQQRMPIELSPSVDKLCRKAPEMGPCQYAREECRRRGGTVHTAAGVEITKQVEAEYDQRVTRIRMKSN